MPANTPDFMAHAWVDALRWAIGEEKVLADFRKATGNAWTPPKTPIDAMVDSASGADKAFIEAFVAWFNENVWGNEPLDELEVT